MSKEQVYQTPKIVEVMTIEHNTLSNMAANPANVCLPNMYDSNNAFEGEAK
jgi:hypothetical protein